MVQELGVQQRGTRVVLSPLMLAGRMEKTGVAEDPAGLRVPFRLTWWQGPLGVAT